MVDPKNRTIVALGNGLLAVAYNKSLIPENRVPNRWEDFLKPEFKGRKFLVDVRPHMYGAFAACPNQGLGLEWMLNYAKKIREQEPIWFRGNSRALTGIMAGEYAMHSGTHYHAAIRAKEKDRTGAFQVKLVEPVPMNLISTETVLGISSHPYAALLFLEHETSPEGQKLIDQHEPLKASVHSPGSVLAKETQGKQVCVNGFDTFQKSAVWMGEAVKAFGFPKAEG
jgi:ABC-type Fe3+ transport system substrate-binding protein